MTTTLPVDTLTALALQQYDATFREPDDQPVDRSRCTVHLARRSTSRTRTHRSAVVRLHNRHGVLVRALYVTCRTGVLVWSVAQPQTVAA